MFEKEKIILEQEKTILEKKYNTISIDWEQISKRLDDQKNLTSQKRKMEVDKLLAFFIFKLSIVTTPLTIGCAFLVIDNISFLSTVIGVGALNLVLYSAITGLLYWDYISQKRKYQKLLTVEMLEDKKSIDQLNKQYTKLKEQVRSLDTQRKNIDKTLSAIETINKLVEENANKKIKFEQIMDDFLNEPIDYTKVHLGVNEYDENIHNSCGKKLIKTYNRD